MIKSFLIKLRQKPKHVRQQVAFGAAAAFTGFVAIFWMATSVPSTIKGITEAVPEGANAFSSFTDKVNKQIESAKEAAATKIATTTASSTSRVATTTPTMATTTASTSSSTVVSTSTLPIYVKEVRIATTTSSTSQVNF